jgi:fatty acid desaturase
LTPGLGFAYLALDWFVVAAIVFFTEKYFSPALYIFAVLLIATRQHAIAVLSHDGSHYRLSADRKRNTVLVNLLSAYPLFFQLEMYRLNHLQHHQYTNEAQDPDVRYQKDLPDYQFPMARQKLFKIFFFEFLGAGVIANFKRAQRYNADPEFKKAVAKDLAETKKLRIGFYIALALVLTVLGGWKIFLMYWMLPLFWILPSILRLRNISEHFGLSLATELKGSRDVDCSWVEGWLLSPHNINLHLVHHLYPSVPFYNLPKMHKVLMGFPAYREGCHRNSSYLLPAQDAVWRDLTRLQTGP